jgi:neutral ceramidase
MAAVLSSLQTVHSFPPSNLAGCSSPTAYEANPASERAQYAHDTDKTMTMLRVTEAAPSEAPRGRGLLNWFAVHPVSMNNSNSFISGDNKGAAELFTEQWAAKQPGLGPGFVAAFAQGAVGDTTPNTLGAFCYGSDVPCDREKSTCGKTNALCWGRGPGW